MCAVAWMFRPSDAATRFAYSEADAGDDDEYAALEKGRSASGGGEKGAIPAHRGSALGDEAGKME